MGEFDTGAENPLGSGVLAMENTWVKATVAFAGAILSFLFGGWSAVLGVLLAFVVTDYVTGFVAAALQGRLSSAVGLRGIAKKVGIFVMVAVAHLVDSTLGEAHLLRDAASFFYLANELLSITENLGRIGVPVPPVIRRAVAVLQSKSGDNDGP